MRRMVTVICTGRKRDPHPKERATLIARFAVVEYEGGGETWEELDVVSREYRDEQQRLLDEHPHYAPPPPDAEGPRQVVTQWITPGGVPRPDNIEGGAEGITFWDAQGAEARYGMRCPTCGLDATLKQERLDRALSEANPAGHGESRLLLRDLC